MYAEQQRAHCYRYIPHMLIVPALFATQTWAEMCVPFSDPPAGTASLMHQIYTLHACLLMADVSMLVRMPVLFVSCDATWPSCLIRHSLAAVLQCI